MTSAQSFKDLVVWQKSMVLAKEVYAVTKQLPQSEQFGLVSQLNRAAISIPSNLAEGSKRGTKKDFLQFLRIASGSAAEVETQLILVREIYPHTSLDVATTLLTEVQKMLTVLIRRMS